MKLDLNPLSPLIDLGSKLIDKLIPDPQEKARAQLALVQLSHDKEMAELNQGLQLALGQIEVNKSEAESGSLFIGGWRPFIGWTCGGGFFYQLIGRPVLGWLATNAWGWTAPPSLEMETLLTLTFGMLGLGAYRSVEKVKGVARS